MALRIVGIDPGTTAAVAVLDLDGELVDYRSAKEFGKDRMIRFIVEQGKPLVVATDVNPVPSRAEELASNMGAELVGPDQDLPVDQKDELVEAFPAREMDAHARDALAAAEYARRTYQDTLHGIRDRARAAGVAERTDDVIELVVKQGMAVGDAIREVRKADAPGDEAPQEAGDTPERDWEALAERRKRRVDLLESKVANLEEYVAELEDDQEEPGVAEDALRERNREIRRLRERVAALEAAVERARADRDRFREAVERLRDGWTVVPAADAADTDADAVVVRGGPVPEGADTVLAPGHVQVDGARVVRLDDIETVDIGDAHVVDPEDLEPGDGEAFMEWLETYRKR